MRFLVRFIGFLFAAGTVVFLVGVAAVAGLIWHYSTDHGRVFADAPAAWRTRMTNAYGDHGQRPVSFLSAGLFL